MYLRGWFSSYLDGWFDPEGTPPGTGGTRPPRLVIQRAPVTEAQPNAASVLSLSQGVKHPETHRAIRALENLVRDLLGRVATIEAPPEDS